MQTLKCRSVQNATHHEPFARPWDEVRRDGKNNSYGLTSQPKLSVCRGHDTHLKLILKLCSVTEKKVVSQAESISVDALVTIRLDKLICLLELAICIHYIHLYHYRCLLISCSGSVNTVLF